MKKRTVLLSVLLSAVLLVSAAAIGGDASDPLISLDYLKTVFSPSAAEAVGQRINKADQAIRDEADKKIRSAVGAAQDTAAAALDFTPIWSESRFKQSDRINGVPGTQFLLLAGEASAALEQGVLVDASDGVEVKSGAALQPMHRYLLAEDSTGGVAVSSRTAVIQYSGSYRLAPSDGPLDYNAMAYALKQLGLFRGSDIAYGSGFELERSLTRVEALVMLIRLLGEEQAAKDSTAALPFTDVPDWATRYVAYAYDKGYTNGVGNRRFAPSSPASSDMYVEFLLRALGYSSTAQRDISDAAARGEKAGVLTAKEALQLKAQPFLRADVAYLSFYALETPVAGSGTPLHQKLESAGVFTGEAYRGAKALVTSARLS